MILHERSTMIRAEVAIPEGDNLYVEGVCLLLVMHMP